MGEFLFMGGFLFMEAFLFREGFLFMGGFLLIGGLLLIGGFLLIGGLFLAVYFGGSVGAANLFWGAYLFLGVYLYLRGGRWVLKTNPQVCKRFASNPQFLPQSFLPLPTPSFPLPPPFAGVGGRFTIFQQQIRRRSSPPPPPHHSSAERCFRRTSLIAFRQGYGPPVSLGGGSRTWGPPPVPNPASPSGTAIAPIKVPGTQINEFTPGSTGED